MGTIHSFFPDLFKANITLQFIPKCSDIDIASFGGNATVVAHM